MKRITPALLLTAFSFFSNSMMAQLQWQNVDTAFGSLPKGFHVFKTTTPLEGKPFVAYYAVADLKNKQLEFTSDTTHQRRMTPAGFYAKNNQPLLVVNSTFFSFATHQNLNMVVKDGKLVSYNVHTTPMRGKDTLLYRHPFASALGINRKRKADVAWTFTDSGMVKPFALQSVVLPLKDSSPTISMSQAKAYVTSPNTTMAPTGNLRKWKMKTAVGGGPVLVQNGKVQVSNQEEVKFTGKAINDLHPRTIMGYTKDGKLIVMVVEGRHPGVAEGASLLHAAQIMVALGCTEALNLDGGGSSCMLINGKQTIAPSDKGLQRPVPAVFIVKEKKKRG